MLKATMHKESAKEFLQRTQPGAWEGAYKSAVRLAQQMAPMNWEQRTSLFNDVLGIIAEGTNSSPQRLVQGDEGDRARQFTARASAVLAGLLLELSESHGEQVEAASMSPYCALLLASCPIDSLADLGLAYFKGPGGVAKLEGLLDQFPNFRALAVADVFDRTGRVIGRAPRLH
jgi:hypothetical protein